MFDPVDVHIGTKIRDRRKKRGLSQIQLGDEIGVKYQQVQKYEDGKNRVSAARLLQISTALGCGIGEFFPEREV